MQWKEISFEPGYSLSEYGTIRKDSTGHEFAKWKTNNGYIQVEIRHRKYSNHRLVGMVYLSDSYFEGAVIHHIDNNIENNHYSNLQWVTQSDNLRFAYAQGRKSNKKEKHPLAKFSIKDIIQIRKSIASGEKGVCMLAREYGVCHQTISNIKNNKTWV
jgi:HNH endonuclease